MSFARQNECDNYYSERDAMEYEHNKLIEFTMERYECDELEAEDIIENERNRSFQLRLEEN